MEFIEKMYCEDIAPSSHNIGDLRLYCCGRRLNAPGHRFGPHARDNYWLIFLKEGCGWYDTGGNHYRLEKGDIFIAYPNRKIRYYADADSVWSIYWVSVGAPSFEDYLSDIGVDESYPIIHVASSLALEHTFELLLETIPDLTLPSRFTCISLLYRFLSLLAPSNHSAVCDRNYVEKAIFFMTSHSSEPITISDVANTVGLTISYFSRLFKKKIGMRPSEWLNQYRLDRASVLLTETSMKIRDIALSVGFDDPLYFTKRFNEHFGVSPTKWRNSDHSTM